MQAIIIVLVIAVAGLGIGTYYFATLPPPVVKEIRIGASLCLTGAYAESGLMYRQAYDMWVEDVNAKGGLLGRPVRIIVYDDKSDPTTSVSLYEKLITVDKVDLILSPYSSAIVFATSSVAEKYGYLFLNSGGTSLDIHTRGYKNIFMVFPGIAQVYSVGFFEFLDTLPSDKKPKTMAFICEDTLFPVQCIMDGAKVEAEKRGYKVVFTERYVKGTTDLSPLIAKIKASAADVLVGGGYFPDSVLIVKTCKELDYNPKAIWCPVGPSMPDFGGTLKKDAMYVWCGVHFHKASAYGKPFADKFNARWGREPSYHAAVGYAACEILERAIKETGTTDNKKLRDFVAKGEFKTVVGPLKWDERGVPAPAMVTIQWQMANGKLTDVVVWPEAAATHKPIYPMPTWKER